MIAGIYMIGGIPMNNKLWISLLSASVMFSGATTFYEKPVAVASEIQVGSNIVDNIKESATNAIDETTQTVKNALVSLKDISKHWAQAAIEKAVQLGYAKGYPDGTFKPNNNVTRAEFIKMTVDALQLPIETGVGGTWYAPYITAAKKAKLYTDSDFKNGTLNSPMTRSEMAKVASRAIGENTTEESKWMYIATKNGLISGLGNGKLGETEKTTRGQSVTIIDRILTVNKGGKLKEDKYAVSSAELAWHGTNIFTVMPEVIIPKDPVKATNSADLWNQEKMKLVSKDGKYSAELLSLVAIDLADPKDPNLKLVPDISKLKWKHETNNSPEGISVSKWKDSYLLYFKSKINYNRDSSKYSKHLNYLPFTIGGVESSNSDAFYKGTLNGPAFVFTNQPFDQTIMIVPKKGFSHKGFFSVSVYTPSFSQYNRVENDIVNVR